MNTIIAHAGESHDSAALSAAHSLEWYMQLLLFLCTIGIVFSVAWLTTKKPDVALLISAFFMLIIGLGVYTVAPIVSVVAISCGFVISLFVTLIGFSAGG